MNPAPLPFPSGGTPTPAVPQLRAVPRPSAETGRLRSLDGLRAVAIAFVLLGHLSGTRGFALLNLEIGDYAHLGVVVFFVISGFLITSLLFSEHAQKGRVSLKLFYARRALRIFPASYAYLAVISLASLAGIVELRRSDLWHAITYTVNYLPERSWHIGHLWSLSVEEQFYLLWPFAFVGLGPRRATWAAAAVILLAPLARLANRFFLMGTPYHDLEMFPMVADSLATGCLLASGRKWLERQNWYLRCFRPGWSLLLLAVILLLNHWAGFTLISIIGTTAINVAIAILIHRSVYSSRDWAGQVLNWRPVAFVGVLSYSLYLWQQVFLDRHSNAWINAFPQNLVLTVMAALASYLLLEKPLLNLRHRLRGRREGQSPAL